MPVARSISISRTPTAEKGLPLTPFSLLRNVPSLAKATTTAVRTHKDPSQHKALNLIKICLLKPDHLCLAPPCSQRGEFFG